MTRFLSALVAALLLTCALASPAAAQGGSKIGTSATLPAACLEGDIFFKSPGTDAGVYWCSTAGTSGTWTGPLFTMTTAYPVCTKYAITQSAGAWLVNGTSAGAISAATSQAVTVFTLPARGKVVGVTLKHGTAFAGPSISALTASLGASGAATAYSTALDVFASVSATAFLDIAEFKSTTSAAHAVVATFTATGANLSVLTAGAVDVWACTVTLP